jgi:hypothetical protein
MWISISFLVSRSMSAADAVADRVYKRAYV